MPVNYQIIPEHSYPHQHVQINDNSVVQDTYDSNANVNALICVFASPKGRSGMHTIKGAANFVDEYGLGSFALYGQPLLNAYTAASSGAATLHCLRVTAEDATYAVSNLVAKYKVEGKNVTLKFSNVPATEELTALDELDSCCTVSGIADDDGFKAVKLFSVAYKGKGSWGKNIRWRIRSEKASDKLNEYKNYSFDVYDFENGLSLKESFPVTFLEDAIYSGASLFADDVINDSDEGSNYVNIVSYPESFIEIFEAYKEANPETTLTINDFDVLLGTNKYTKEAIENLIIVPEDLEGSTQTISVSSTAGVPLLGGSDGALDVSKSAEERETTLTDLYTKAFAGKIDPLIVSKNRYPATLILDANYDPKVKRELAALVLKRKDCMGMLDCGTGIALKSAVASYVKANLDDFVSSRVLTIEPYCMKARDPLTKKTVVVTSTWWIAKNYPTHFVNWNGKHKPMAGNRYGIIEGCIKNSVYPVFDEDIDSELMDELADMHVNFAKFNPNQEVVRAMQDTRQIQLSNLSEQNNVLILLDIKRDAEKLCAQFEYEFSEAEDIQRFNAALSTLTGKYADAQVRKITAGFSKNNWESQHQIIHLNIQMVHKDLVRTTIIEIDVNRDEI